MTRVRGCRVGLACRVGTWMLTLCAPGLADGQMLMMLAGLMGGSFEAMVPKLKPLLVSFGQELVDKARWRLQLSVMYG
mgnify:CR=1 FL=1